MSKPFTRALVILSLPVVLAACASSGSRDSAPDERAAEDAAGSTTNGAPVESADVNGLPAAEMPEVSTRIASEFESAVGLLQDGRHTEAEVLLLSITTEHPELAGPWINLGQVYVALDQPEEARRAFESAIQANPWNCTGYNELGLLSRVNGDFEAAERYYLGCIDKVPGNGAANLNLGILYELYLGRLSEALVYYRQYQALLTEPDRRVQGWVMDLERRLGV